MVYIDNNPWLQPDWMPWDITEWVGELADFNFDIKYRPGKANTDADILSRHKGWSGVHSHNDMISFWPSGVGTKDQRVSWHGLLHCLIRPQGLRTKDRKRQRVKKFVQHSRMIGASITWWPICQISKHHQNYTTGVYVHRQSAYCMSGKTLRLNGILYWQGWWQEAVGTPRNIQREGVKAPAQWHGPCVC